MKKTLSLVMVIAVTACLVFSLGVSAYADAPALTTIIINGGTSIPVDGANVPAATPAPAAVTPVITKSPTGETIKTGEEAVFVAHASGASSVTWFIVSADDGTYYEVAEASSHFEGLTYEAANTDRLVLKSIPASMDGWKVRARFTNEIGNTWTDSAVITITDAAEAAASQQTVEQANEAGVIGDGPAETAAPEAPASTTTTNGMIGDGTGSTSTTAPTPVPAPTGDDSSLPSGGGYSSAAEAVGAVTNRAETKSHTLAYVLGGIAGVAVLGVCGTLIYMKKNNMTIGDGYDDIDGIDEASFDAARNDKKK